MKAKQTKYLIDLKTGEFIHEKCSPVSLEESAQEEMKEASVVGLFPTYTYQTFEGYGCSMTESACYLLSQMDAETRREALKCWFGPEGMNARFIRMHLDSVDFSLSEYQAVADPIADPELATFNIDRDRQYIIPVVKEALSLCEQPLSVLISPWSPPAQWKTPPEMKANDTPIYGSAEQEVDFTKPGRMFGGRLKPEHYGDWAKYIVKFIQEYLAEGIPVTMLSVQNEPAAAPFWESCLWSAQQEKTFLRDYLYPELKAAGLTDRLKIFVWDHNKERMPERIDEIMTDDVKDMVGGFAYHWYTGDHFEALDMMRQKYPDKILMHTESCCMHIPGKTTMSEDEDDDIFDPLNPLNGLSNDNPAEIDLIDAHMYAHDIIGDLNHGMQRWIDWNMILNRKGGPRHVPCGVTAPLVFEEGATFSRTMTYEYLKAFAGTIQPGSVRIGRSVFSPKVEVVAAKNPDGTIGVILLNTQNMDLTVNIRVSGYVTEVELPARSLSSVIFSE